MSLFINKLPNKACLTTGFEFIVCNNVWRDSFLNLLKSWSGDNCYIGGNLVSVGYYSIKLKLLFIFNL